MDVFKEYSQTSFMCRACGQLLIPSKFNLCADYSDKIHLYLQGSYKKYSSIKCREYSRISEEIPLTVKCINSGCASSIEVIAKVEADQVLYKNDLDIDLDTKIDSFDVRDASIIEFCQNREICDVQLRIICKTDVNGTAKCYLGYEEESGKLLRPVRSVYEFSWPNSLLEFHVGEIYTFKVLAFIHGLVQCRTDKPHKNEDIVINETKITAHRKRKTWNPCTLQNIASRNIFEIFPQKYLKDLKYVETNVDCPSAGVLTLDKNDVKIYEYFGKKRVKLWNNGQVFDFPLTAVSTDCPESDRFRQALVLLGLGRPYNGDADKFYPARCYVLGLAVYLY